MPAFGSLLNRGADQGHRRLRAEPVELCTPWPAHATVFAALSWDPQIRGFLIVLTALLVLPGSVYLLLATNTGARLGFQLAVAGLAGWCMTMGVIWAVFGIGMVGRSPSWKVQQIIQGDLISQSTVGVIDARFFETFKVMALDNPKRGDARLSRQGACARYRGHKGGRAGAQGGKVPGPVQELGHRLRGAERVREAGQGAVQAQASQVLVEARLHFLHDPHYLVIQVQPAIKQPGSAVAAKPEPNPDATPVYVVLERDLGSVRFPPVMFATAWGIIFVLACWNLHRRDLEIICPQGRPRRPDNLVANVLNNVMTDRKGQR